jgi:hypothetical protein
LRENNIPIDKGVIEATSSGTQRDLGKTRLEALAMVRGKLRASEMSLFAAQTYDQQRRYAKLLHARNLKINPENFVNLREDHLC